MLSTARAVLFADDDPNDRYLMLQAWKEAGIKHRIVEVDDGEEVIAYLSGTGKFSDRTRYPAPCLAILDLNMPRKSGFETLQWIRHSQAWSLLPVLILSASAHPREVTVAYQMGAYAYLTKPSRAAELIDLVTAINTFWLRFAEAPPDRSADKNR